MPSHHTSSLELFAQKLLIGLVTLVVITIPLMLVLSWKYGFHDLTYLYMLLTLWVIYLYTQRRKLPAQAVVHATWIGLLSISIGAVLSFGLASHFLLFASLSALVITIAYGANKAMWFCGAYLMILGIYSVIFSSEPALPAHGVEQLGSEAITLFTALASTAILLIATSSVHCQLREKISNLQAAKRRAEHQANHDPLTGLANLALSKERADMAIGLARRSGHKVALLFIDLDGFKAINDNFGHEAGDKVLITISKRLRDVLRDSDTTCRVGGDEFLIVLAEIDRRADIDRLCERLHREISTPISFQQREVSAGASIGAAIYPDHGTDFKTLRALADRAMYQTKNEGKGGFRYIDGPKD